MFFAPRWGPHADKRKKQYGILNNQIAYTWLFGETQPTGNGDWKLIGEKVTLVIDAEQEFIITLYPNKYRDKYTARNARLRRADGNIRQEWTNGFYNTSCIHNDSNNMLLDYVYKNDKQLAEYNGSECSMAINNNSTS